MLGKYSCFGAQLNRVNRQNTVQAEREINCAGSSSLPKHALNSIMSKKRRAEEEVEDYSVTHVPPYEGQMMSEWRPDSCWSWLVCFASGISVAIVAGVTYSFGLLLPPLMENFEETRQAAGKRFRDAHKTKGRFTRYDRPTARIVSCKLNQQLAYDCRVRHKKCRTTIVGDRQC